MGDSARRAGSGGASPPLTGSAPTGTPPASGAPGATPAGGSPGTPATNPTTPAATPFTDSDVLDAANPGAAARLRPNVGGGATSVGPTAPATVTPNATRPEDLFDYAEGRGRTRVQERPGYVSGILRGSQWQPVFGDGGNWFTRGLSDAGNWVMDELGGSLSNLVHTRAGVETVVPLTDQLTLGFQARARKIREDELPIGDPRRMGIAELRDAHPGALPIWLEGSLGQSLGLSLRHSIPIGSVGTVNFGFEAGQDLNLTMQRLVFAPGRGRDIDDSGSALLRLRHMPTSAAGLRAMETGATFRLSGSARLRVDAGLGLGVSVPALNNLVQVGATVEVGAYASLSGNFSMQVQRLQEGRARLTLGTGGDASAGLQLRALVGVDVNRDEVAKLLRNFAHYVSSGGDPREFQMNVSTERERELADDLGGYMRLLVANIAEGAGSAVIDALVGQYTSIYLEARAGFTVGKNMSLNVDFDLESTEMIELPRADMVPPAMRGGVAADRPVRVRVGELAGLAYDLAVHGDMRLVQQLTHIRGSGVRINEQVTTSTTTREYGITLRLPFMEYVNNGRTSDTVIDRYTPELGRVRTSLAEFNRTYRSLFGDAEDSSAQVRVHTPEGTGEAEVFFGSDENFSADLVVQGNIERWTSYSDMQDLVGVLDVLSNGRMSARAQEALAQGPYRNDTVGDDLNPIHQLFFKPREFGRSITHLHIWLGEAGLRELLERNLTEDELYAAIGRVFANLDTAGGRALPPWARPGADRRTEREKAEERDDGWYHDSGTGRGSRMPRPGPWDHDLEAARYLVDNLIRLRSQMRRARTPVQEEAVAKEIRDFLRDARDKLPAFAALASMVDERHRAVEMRLSAVRDGATPIRFTYIQDGRAAEILYATGFAQMAMQQYQRFAPVLDVETRLRVGNLLGELHDVLNSPSPDMYRLNGAQRLLQAELARMDQSAARLADRIDSDLGVGRAFLDALPDAGTIQRVLPGALGEELANLRLMTWQELSVASPDLAHLRQLFSQILTRLPTYRRIKAAAPLVDSTARLANALAERDSALAGQARRAVDHFRESLAEPLRSDATTDPALEGLHDMYTRLRDAAGERADGAIEQALAAANDPVAALPSGTPGTARAHTTPDDLARARTGLAERYQALSGNPNAGPLSYFERAGVVPAAYLGVPYTSGGDGIVTGSMLREAELAMATSRPTGDLNIPPLTDDKVAELLALARGGKAVDFLTGAEALRFIPEQLFEDPRRHVVEFFLEDMPAAERRRLGQHLSTRRRSAVERILGEFDADVLRTDAHRRERRLLLRDNPRFDEDLKFLKDLWQRHPEQLEAAINDLGYGMVLDTWHSRSTARLEAVFSQMSGDELNAMVRELDGDQRKRFLELIRSSDLRPQTRAKIAGQIVDDHFFWRNDEELVEALVTGMNAGDLRLFFDQLHTDGKLEDFLSAGGFWQTLLIIFTFGLALLFTHDNAAARRVVAQQGWNVDELAAEYRGRPNREAAFIRAAERVWFEAALNTAPMDPAVRGSIRVVHDLIGNVKYYHFADFPEEAQRLVREMAKGAGRQLARRIGDIASQGGSIEQIGEEYRRFFAGLSPEAVAQQLRTGDTDGSASIIAKALADGAVAGLIIASQDPRNRFITPQLIGNIIGTLNKLDKPLSLRPGGSDPHLAPGVYEGLVEKWELYRQYTGFDYRQVQILYGGLAIAAGAVAFGPTVSIATDENPMVDGKIQITDNFQQVICFHESAHVIQQMIYGTQLNAFIDQGFHIHSAGNRNLAYRVTQDMFDQATSIHDFRQHWEQQAELIEQSMRMLWARSRELNTTNTVLIDAYPGPGRSLNVAGGSIELTPARWAKMVRFVREFGDSARRAYGPTGGAFQYTPVRPNPS